MIYEDRIIKKDEVLEGDYVGSYSRFNGEKISFYELKDGSVYSLEETNIIYRIK